ncbi:MAG: hypothetical protein ABI047_07045 [Jatrophihabitantaceae bacterium]
MSEHRSEARSAAIQAMSVRRVSIARGTSAALSELAVGAKSRGQK